MYRYFSILFKIYILIIYSYEIWVQYNVVGLPAGFTAAFRADISDENVLLGTIWYFVYYTNKEKYVGDYSKITKQVSREIFVFGHHSAYNIAL